MHEISNARKFSLLGGETEEGGVEKFIVEYISKKTRKIRNL